MAKLVTKFKYYKPTSKKNIGGLVKYIATREGVEKLYEVKENVSVTKKQTEIIKDILERFSDSVQMFEYEDYIANPSARTPRSLLLVLLKITLIMCWKIQHTQITLPPVRESKSTALMVCFLPMTRI